MAAVRVFDPAMCCSTGSHEEKLARVAEVRDAIRERIAVWVKTLHFASETARGQVLPRNRSR